MCNFFSCILTREKQILWYIGTNSHDDILRANNIKDDKLEDRDFVRIEINPVSREWVYNIDEEITLPEWYTEKRDNLEKMVMDFFNSQIKPHTEIKNRKTIIASMFAYAYERSTVDAHEGSTVDAYKESIVNAHKGSKVYANEGSTVYAYEGSTVDAYEGSKVYAYKESIVNAYEGSIVNANEGSIVDAYEGSKVYAYEGSIVHERV